MNEVLPSNTQLKRKYFVGTVGNFPVEGKLMVQIEGKSLGVFNLNGEFMAVLNLCPHALAPVCLGKVGGTTARSNVGEFNWERDGEILSCPWHGWEFDLKNGQCLTDKRKLKRYKVSVEDQKIYVEV